MDNQTPFDALDATFAVLGAEPTRLAINGAALGAGLPSRRIPLGELRAMLLHPATSHAARDAALGELVRRAQRHGGHWTVGLVGVLLPGLRGACAPLVDACPDKLADLQAAAVVGLIEAIPTVGPGTRRIAARLTWAGLRRAHQLGKAELAERGRPTHRPVAHEPPRPWRHPDLVLAEAVAERVIDREDAELIGETYIGGVPLRVVARRQGVAYNTLQKRRRRAALALVPWLKRRIANQIVP